MAAAARVSWFVTLRRTDTPECWLTLGLRRASWLTRATISDMYSGKSRRTGREASNTRASWATIASSVSRSGG